MSVLSLGTSATDKLFYEFIKPGLETEFIENSTIYGRFGKDTESCHGKYGVMKLATKAAKSTRPAGSTTFPTAKQGAYDEFYFYMKRYYATLQFDGLAIASGKGKGAVKDVLTAETDGIMVQTANVLNRFFWGDGSGRLAQLSALISGSVTGYVDGPFFGKDSNEYTNPSAYLDEGQVVELYSSGSLQAGPVEISSISLGGAGTDTITFAEAISAADDSYIFLEDTYAASEAAGTGVPMGLMGIIATTNPYVGTTQMSAFQNINRTGNTFAQAQVFDMGTSAAAPAVLTDKQVLKVIMKCEKFGKVKVIITNDVIWRNWAEILKADSILTNEPELWGGHAGFSFYGGKNNKIPVIYDIDCPDQDLFFIDDEAIIVSTPLEGGLDWLPGDSGHVLTRVQGKDEYTANLLWYYNMTCRRPQALGLLRYVKHAST